jgi:hypothetical protein
MTPSGLPWQLLFWTIAAVLQVTDTAAFFTHVSPRQHAFVPVSSMFQSYYYGYPPQSQSALYFSVKDDKDKTTKTKDDDGNEATLTDVDARVLQEMLQEEKLNANQEENMRQLLARGIRAKEPTRKDNVEEVDETGFQSSILKTLGNNGLWKSLERSTQDFVESAKMFVANRVERDTKLLGALGVFAFERAMQDVSRALPAAAKATKKTVLLLTNSTSASTTKTTATTTTFDDMKLPMDEIKSISYDIREILKTGGAAGPASRRGLKTAARAGSKNSKERFAKALQRKQVTTLRQEKENPMGKSGRVASQFLDTAYELKRELQVEPNKPGYKTKNVRATVADVSNRLKSGATKILAAASRDKPALLQGSAPKKGAALPLKSATVQDNVMDATVAAFKAAAQPKVNVMDATVAAFKAAAQPEVVETPITPKPETNKASFFSTAVRRVLATATEEKPTQSQGAAKEREDVPLKSATIQDNAMDATVAAFKAAAQPKVVETPIAPKPETKKAAFFSTTVTAEEVQLQGELKAELSSLIHRLEICIYSPETTWLQPDIVESVFFAELTSESIEPIITTMVNAKQILVEEKKLKSKSASSKLTRSLFDSLVVGKELLDDVIETAQSSGSQAMVDYLQRQLFHGDDDTLDRGLNLVSRLGYVEQQILSFEEGTTTAPQGVQKPAPLESFEEFVTQAFGTKKQVVEEPVFVEPPSETFESVVMEEEDILVETYKADEEAIRYVVAEMVPTKPASKKGASKASYSYVDVVPETYVDVVPETQDAEVYDYLVTPEQVGDNEVLSDDEASVYADIVTDDDDDYDESKAKAVSSAPEDDEEREAEKPNALIQLTLRSLDVLLFLIEKAVTVRRFICISVSSRAMYPLSHALFCLHLLVLHSQVALPSLFAAGGIASSRLTRVKSEGLGSKGWKLIASAKTGSKRY